MERNSILDEQVIQSLCSEYQSLWLVDVSDSSMVSYKVNKEITFPGIEEFIPKLKSYEYARHWYTDNYVKLEEREYVRYASSMEHVIEELTDNGSYYVEFVRSYNGVNNYNQICYTRVDDGREGIKVFLLGFRDIDARKKSEVDALTGLFNRDAFLKYTGKLLEHYKGTSFDIIISDIVDFKSVNERYGTKVGDRVLQAAGNFLRTKSKPGNVIGRYGGDQFAVALAHSETEKILKDAALSFQVDYDNDLPPITFKYGVYENINPDQLLSAQCDNARIALNSIKHKYGEIVAIFDDRIREEIEHNRRIEENMHKALAEKQFKVYYQPKHDALTGKMVGAEALVRWIHPEFGFMSPAEFIPVFERNGFINEVDNYVWQRTCENLRRWIDKGFEVVPVSVNKSKLAFKERNLKDRIDKPVRKYNLSKELLHIEITESLMEDDVEALIATMSEIKELGYKFELDDFGAGYSSINILSTLPLDVVKLDMSFIKQFGITKRIKVLAACINLAKNLGYETISEGVETKEQLNALKTLGVDAIQGYYYSKPLTEEEFEQYMLKEAEE